MNVHIVCANPHDDRIIPRMVRALSGRFGWSVGRKPDGNADVNFLSAYFESRNIREMPHPVAAYFTHREEVPPEGRKAQNYDETAAAVDLRIATCAMYAVGLEAYGPTVQVPAPVELDRFVPGKAKRRPRPMAMFSGFTYVNGRKGNSLAERLVRSSVGERCDWQASGRGWPVRTSLLPWDKMAEFYQNADIYVCTSLVEGIPMPPLEALACGVSVVIPTGVGLLDELPDLQGIHRYRCGDAEDLQRGLQEAIETRPQVVPEDLRGALEGHGVMAWGDAHMQALTELVE